MNFFPCWFWENGIDDALLTVLNGNILTLELKPGELAHGNMDTQVRNSSSAAFPSHHWLTGVMYNYAVHANKEAGWQRTLEFPEVTQIAKYEPGQY